MLLAHQIAHHLQRNRGRRVAPSQPSRPATAPSRQSLHLQEASRKATTAPTHGHRSETALLLCLRTWLKQNCQKHERPRSTLMQMLQCHNTTRSESTHIQGVSLIMISLWVQHSSGLVLERMIAQHAADSLAAVHNPTAQASHRPDHKDCTSYLQELPRRI